MHVKLYVFSNTISLLSLFLSSVSATSVTVDNNTLNTAELPPCLLDCFDELKQCRFSKKKQILKILTTPFRKILKILRLVVLPKVPFVVYNLFSVLPWNENFLQTHFRLFKIVHLFASWKYHTFYFINTCFQVHFC